MAEAELPRASQAFTALTQIQLQAAAQTCQIYSTCMPKESSYQSENTVSVAAGFQPFLKFVTVLKYDLTV